MKIRIGIKEDLPQVLQLVNELAAHVGAPQEVDNTVERMEKDGFGPNKVFNFLVAEENDQIVALALFYWSYSTWKGKCLYLEDLVITLEHRRKGIGSLLFKELIEIAKANEARRLSWQVLESNKPAIAFYKSIGAHLDPEVINGKLTYEQLNELG